VPPPELDPRDARLELARRYLHIFGPATPEAFAGWAGIVPRVGVAVFDALGRSLTPVRTPIVDARILTRDEPTLRATPGSAASARLLPSGDAYFLSREPNANYWSPTPTVVACSGPLASGRVPSSSRARSSGRGDALRRR
jgi:hypothetical protein